MPGRVSQAPVEVIVAPTSQKARVSQTPVEVIVAPTSQKARVSQVVVEVLVRNTFATGAISVSGTLTLRSLARVQATTSISLSGTTVMRGESYSGEVLADAPMRYYRLDETSGSTAFDISGNGQDGTYIDIGPDTASALPAIRDGSSIYFNHPSNNARVQIPEFYRANDWSVEFWVKAGTTVTGKHYILGLESIAGNGGFLIVNGAYSVVRFMADNNTGLYDIYPFFPPFDRWYHWVWTYEYAQDLKAYCNGILVLYNIGYAPFKTDSIGMWLGGAGYNTYIDEVALYDYPLSAARVLEHYKAGVRTPNNIIALNIPVADVSGALALRTRVKGTAALSLSGTLSFQGHISLHANCAISLAGTLALHATVRLRGSAAASFAGVLDLSSTVPFRGTVNIGLTGELALSVDSPPPLNSDTIASSAVRRAGVYNEIAHAVIRPGWVHDGRAQHLDGLPSEPGLEGLSAVSVCRMGDMRQAVASACVDPDSLDSVVTVRVQSGTEAFGFPHEAFRTTQDIFDVSLVAAQNPLNGTGLYQSRDKTLILGVWYGDAQDDGSTFALLVSYDRGMSWRQIWASGGSHDVEAPRLVTHAVTGALYLFYRSNVGGGTRQLRYLVASGSPQSWATSFAWDAGSAQVDTFDLAVSGADAAPFDVFHDLAGWVLGIWRATGTVVHRVVGVSTSSAPTGFVTGTADLNASSAIPWLKVGRTGRYDEFGNFPSGRILCVYREEPSPWTQYMVVDTSAGVGTPSSWRYLYNNYAFPRNAGAWASGDRVWRATWQAGDEIFGKAATLLDREHFNYRLTPSTSISYGTDPSYEFENYVDVDNHGPTPTDEDSAQRFASFWTRSNERESIAFPPYEAGMDCQFDFNVWPLHGRYHNIWFVIDDPLHPDTPIFKMDFYVGNDAAEGQHPHDTARGCRVWFCKRGTVPDRAIKDSGTGDRYHHPILHMFDGFAARAQNERPFKFRIKYVYATDQFELYWQNDEGTYIPFIPYANYTGDDRRQYVDVGPSGSNDIYVPSDDEQYWRQDRRGLWPRRIYIGCPEVKPAVEQQSTLRIGKLVNTQSVSTGLDPDPEDEEASPTGPAEGGQPPHTSPVGPSLAPGDYAHSRPAGLPSLVPRLSGALDFFWVDTDVQDTLYRMTYGYPWQDALTATEGSSNVQSDSGADQGTLSLRNTDNYERTAIYDQDRLYHAFMWARAGTKDRTQGSDGIWGKWVVDFFGTSDTGMSTDSGEGPIKTLMMYSPLRNMARSYQTISFSALQPPAVTDINGDPVDPPVEDVKKTRETAVIYMVDFTRPNDDTAPVDAKGRLMKFESYIARYIWEDVLALPGDKLDQRRVGVTPASFVINQSGSDTDMLSELSRLWEELGLSWRYDYWAGGVLRVRPRLKLIPYSFGTDYTLPIWTCVATPFTRNEDDWGRAGNVQTTATNMESNPNTAVSRVAPWPDGTQTVDKQIDAFGSRESQEALARMYAKDQPLAALYKEWKGARGLEVPIPAYPYITVGATVIFDTDNPAWPQAFRDKMAARYADLARVWLVDALSTKWDATSYMKNATVISPTPFPGD